MQGNLVLKRKIGERIHIGEDIVIELRKVQGNSATIAVLAPKELRVLRSELLEASDGLDEPILGIPAE
jgi:carbon storage regulator